MTNPWLKHSVPVQGHKKTKCPSLPGFAVQSVTLFSEYRSASRPSILPEFSEKFEEIASAVHDKFSCFVSSNHC